MRCSHARVATKPNPRAASSGFSRKLRAYFEQGGLVRNAERLAEWLTERGEPVGSGSTGAWVNGHSLPHARFIGHIERLMGAPWSYLDDPNTPWPRPLTREALADLIALLPLEQVRAIVDQLESAARGQEPPQ